MSRHSTEDLEALKVEAADQAKDAPERYRPDVRHRGGWLWEAQVVTTHVLRIVGEQGEPVEPFEVETRLLEPPARPGQRWAWWKARRMVAAAHRKDVREQQPWAVQRG
jgi:hypothetical protein